MLAFQGFNKCLTPFALICFIFHPFFYACLNGISINASRISSKFGFSLLFRTFVHSRSMNDNHNFLVIFVFRHIDMNLQYATKRLESSFQNQCVSTLWVASSFKNTWPSGKCPFQYNKMHSMLDKERDSTSLLWFVSKQGKILSK